MPFQMGTVEAGQALRRALAPGGAVVMNVISAVQGPDGQLFRGIYQALKASFAQVQVYCVDGPQQPARKQNLMLVAFAGAEARHPMLPPEAAQARPGMAESDRMLEQRYTGPLTCDVPALRDDFAPVERYALMLLRP